MQCGNFGRQMAEMGHERRLGCSRPVRLSALPRLRPKWCNSAICRKWATRRREQLQQRRVQRQAYSITSSARKRNAPGMVNPIAFAVLRFRTSSNFVVCSTGRSEGFTPLKILSTKYAPRCARAVSEASEPGHQFMPSLTFAGGRLLLIYYDLRDDVSQSFAAFADDTSARPSGHPTDDGHPRVPRHAGTDARRSRRPLKVSNYADGRQLRLGSLVIEQMQYQTRPTCRCSSWARCRSSAITSTSRRRRPSYRMPAAEWSYNTQAGTTLPVFQAVWTDNRDVRPPTVRNPVCLLSRSGRTCHSGGVLRASPAVRWRCLPSDPSAARGLQ